MTNPWNLIDREQQVMDLMSFGHGNKQIADSLGLSQKTVELYRSHALNKMGCRANSIRAAVLWDRFAMGRDEAVDNSEEVRRAN